MRDINYAGFWVRALASLIDTFVVALPIAVVVYMFSGGEWFDWSLYQQNIHAALEGKASALENKPKTNITWEIIFELSVLVVTMMFWRKWRGATPGKHFVGIKIVDHKSLEIVESKAALIRSISYFASAFIFMLGFFMVAFRKDKRGLHDLLAGTIVIYDDKTTANQTTEA